MRGAKLPFLHLDIIKKISVMYSLACEYYSKEFTNIGDLINDVLISGMDPNYYITKNGVNIGEMVIDLIPF